MWGRWVHGNRKQNENQPPEYKTLRNLQILEGVLIAVHIMYGVGSGLFYLNIKCQKCQKFWVTPVGDMDSSVTEFWSKEWYKSVIPLVEVVAPWYRYCFNILFLYLVWFFGAILITWRISSWVCMMKRNAAGICKEVQQAFASLRSGKRNMENHLMTVLVVWFLR